MRWRWFVLCVLGTSLAANFGSAGPLEKQAARNVKLAPYGKRVFVDEFRGNERASAIITGVGQQALGRLFGAYMGPYMAAYVFDARGNCVAFDDQGAQPVRDDLAVAWHPNQPGHYALEVFNQGTYGNTFRLVVR